MTTVSPEVIEVFEGLNQSYIEMESKEPQPPKCHLQYMKAESGDYGEWWWECRYCGHTKHGSNGYQGER